MGNSSVEKLSENMQKMFAQLMEQTRTRSSSAPEGLKTILEANPVKLSCPGDYFIWARNASLIRITRSANLFDGGCKETRGCGTGAVGSESATCYGVAACIDGEVCLRTS